MKTREEIRFIERTKLDFIEHSDIVKMIDFINVAALIDLRLSFEAQQELFQFEDEFNKKKQQQERDQGCQE